MSNNNSENNGNYYQKTEPYSNTPTYAQPYAQPYIPTYSTTIATDAVPVGNGGDNIPENVVDCYRLSKTVMLFAMIDIFFGAFYAFYSCYYLLPLLIAIYGYYSAKNYSAGGVLCYTVYQIVINILRLTLSVYSYVLIRQDNTITDYSYYDWYIVFAVFTSLLGLYIARFGYKLSF